VLVGISTERGINNGQPSCMRAASPRVRPRPGEVVVHVGAGTATTTAILPSSWAAAAR
jgi:protein-L-isoaspartate(D-aspartate) O-methyltransferase